MRSTLCRFFCAATSFVLISIWRVAEAQAEEHRPPHIVFVVADDLGYNDVSFHGSPQVLTPHIDDIARAGFAMMAYYAQPVCSPSRASILSGRHVVHTGVYMPFAQGTALRLRPDFGLLPEYLQRCCNYSTHAVGKWHLGQASRDVLPTTRGFDSFFGYWSGAEDHWTHDTKGAYDFNDNQAAVPGQAHGNITLRVATEFNNTFGTFAIAERATQIIKRFSPDSPKPLFLYLAFQNVHWPLQAPDGYFEEFANRTGGDQNRQYVCAMTDMLDEAVGNVTQALKDQGIIDSTLFVFVSDNGGPTHDNEGTSSNNFPLRGGKNTLWEGGTRVVGAVRGPGIPSAGNGAISFSYERHHVTDWLPTLVVAASGSDDWQQFGPPSAPAFEFGDGINNWPMFAAGGTPGSSQRDWLLYEAHPLNATGSAVTHGNALAVGDWKIVQLGPEQGSGEDGWFAAPGQRVLDVSFVVACNDPDSPSHGPRTGAAKNNRECVDAFCLFNVSADPCEYTDLAAQCPDIVKQLETQLASFQARAVPPVQPVGCQPVQVQLPSGAKAWQPCDGGVDLPIVETGPRR